MDFPRTGKEEKIYLAASVCLPVDALQHNRAASASGTGVINGQTKAKLGCPAHSVWAAFLFSGRRSGKLFFPRRGLQREWWKRCSCGVPSCVREQRWGEQSKSVSSGHYSPGLHLKVIFFNGLRAICEFSWSVFSQFVSCILRYDLNDTHVPRLLLVFAITFPFPPVWPFIRGREQNQCSNCKTMRSLWKMLRLQPAA